MLQPAYPQLLEAPVVQAVEVLADHRVVGGQRLPQEVLIPEVARLGKHRVPRDLPHRPPFGKDRDVAHDNVRADARCASPQVGAHTARLCGNVNSTDNHRHAGHADHAQHATFVHFRTPLPDPSFQRTAPGHLPFEPYASATPEDHHWPKNPPRNLKRATGLEPATISLEG